MASSIVILNSMNNSENVSIMSHHHKKSLNAPAQNLEPKSPTKLSGHSSSRASSASTSASNALFPNLTPQATHIATTSHLTNFNRPVSTGQIVNILTRKASDLQKNLTKSPDKSSLTPPLSLSEPNFSAKESPKSPPSTLTVNNLNHFDHLNETAKNFADTLSPIPSYSSKSSSPNDPNSPILTIKCKPVKQSQSSKDCECNKSPQTLKSASTNCDGQGPKSAGPLSSSSAGRAKKKVSFNDNLLKVHLIPNLTSFLNVERCKTNGDAMLSIEEQANGSVGEDEAEPDSPLIETHFDFSDHQAHHCQEANPSFIKPTIAKTHLKHIQSDQTISNDLKRSVRNHSLGNHLQVVKLTVHPNKNHSDSRTQNFLTLVGNNSFSQKPTVTKRESSASSRNIHSQLFAQQRRSHTFHYDDLDPTDSMEDIKTSSSSINFAKTPKFMLTGAKKHMKSDYSKQSSATLHPESNEAKNKARQLDSSKENDLNLNSAKRPPKFVFLKHDDNMTREPSFVKAHVDKSIFNNSSSSFASDSQHKTSVETKNASMNKNASLNSVNQLIALKDVNYYLNNGAKSNLKALKSTHPHQSGLNDIGKIKLKSNGHLTNISNLDLDFRRTSSALPLLRNNIGTGSSGKYSNQPALNESAKFSNNLSYKILNSSPLSNSLTRAKTFLLNQNLTSNNHIDKKIKGSSIEKTTF
ncbi:hypothetical protein BpHYR1_018477 [Brachionus plicatilis]|uniref:Uncharacterized protein n=1 Tax=Brachionus plicatilis TaxID=10195 RepID=A0A3M7Q0S0_BRAPC|nr:hypothetical protein BpHYR1_018477 [Brachionus plicatilis]